MPPLEREPDTVTTEAEIIARARAVRARLYGAVPVRPVVVRPAPMPVKPSLAVPSTLRSKEKPLPAIPPEAASIMLDGDPPPASLNVTLTAILHTTARCFDLDVTDLLSDRRAHPLPIARQIAMYLATKLMKLGPSYLGFQLGRDHTTILFAHRKIGALYDARDPATITAINAIMSALFAGKEEFPVLPPTVPITRHPWTESDFAELDRLWAEGVHPKVIAEALGRDYRRVQAAASRRKLRRPPRSAVQKTAAPWKRQSFPWDDHIDLMKRMRQAGEPAKYIRLELIKASGRRISLSRVKERLLHFEATGAITRRKGKPAPLPQSGDA